MRIQHNISALNAHRQLGTNNTAVGKNLEKLSSGFRINRAGDDAAGLAISEKMRGQIRGLDMASRNANDGISLIQTAEGALSETHSILQRVRELAVQSSNGTYEQGSVNSDRDQLQKEVAALKSEIDRIADSTHFNNKKLLNGELGTGGAAVAATTTEYTGGKFKTEAVKGITSVTLNPANLGHGDSLTIGDKTFMFYGKVANTAAQNATEFGAAPDVATGVTLIKLDTLTNKDTEALATTLAAAAPSGFAGKLAGATDLKDDGTAITAKTLIFTADEGGIGNSNLGEVKLTKANGTNGTVTTAVEKTGKDAVEATKEKFATATVDASKLLGVEASKTSTKNKLTIVAGGVTNELDVLTQAAYDVLDADDKKTAIAEGYSLQAVADKLNALDANKNDNITVTGSKMTFTAADAQTNTADEIKAFANAITLTGKAVVADEGVTFQIGANGGADQQVTLNVEDQHCKTLGIDGIDISTRLGANSAIDLIDKATGKVSATRADLGALQNRLEHTISNLGTSVENLTAAESRIRDVDMAKEMMEMTKNNILSQAAQAMLAQANTQPQSVLQLLQ